MRIVSGRAFSSADKENTAKVLIVNRSFAKLYLSERALGDKVSGFAGSDNATGDYEVVGIIDDVLEHGLTDKVQPEIYSLQRQTVFRSTSPGFVLRMKQDPRDL